MKGLCVYVDGGKGHYVPAKAVAEQLQELGVETAFEEFFDYLDIRWMGRINKLFWRTMLRMPRLEQHISKHNDADSNGMEWGIRFACRHCVRMFEANLEEFRPDFIFATHPYASTILSEMLAFMKVDIPVYYFATDVFNAPVASICDRLRRFYISTEEGAERAIRMGQRKDTVAVAPFPLQKDIAEGPRLSKEEARRKIGFDERLFTLQLNLGGEGIGSLSLLEALLKADVPMQIAIIGGMDKKAKKHISRIVSMHKAGNVHVHAPGFVSNVNEYLAASDIVAGRAGINTIVEAMYAHRPFLITELVYTVIPSAEYIEKHHVGWNCADDSHKAAEIVLEHATSMEKLAEMDSAFASIPIEYSARHLAQMLIEDAGSILQSEKDGTAADCR